MNSEKSFGDFQFPVGVDLTHEEVIVVDANKHTVEFFNFEGENLQTISKDLDGPSIVTLLLDGNVVISDKNGVWAFDMDGEFVKELKLKGQFSIFCHKSSEPKTKFSLNFDRNLKLTYGNGIMPSFLEL